MGTEAEPLFLRDSSGLYNATAIFHLVNSYSSEDRRLLFDQLQVSSVDELVQLLTHGSAQDGNGSYGPSRPSVADLEAFTEYRVHKLLLLYVPPIFFIIGLIGNTLSAVILTRPPMRSISTYRYLTMLSFTDSLVLTVGLLRMWLGELVVGNDVLDRWTWICKLVNVVGYTVSNFSVWLIVAVTAERFVAVCYPLMAPSVCSRRRSTRVMLAVLAVQFVIHVHFAWTTGVYTARTVDNATEAVIPVSDGDCGALAGFETLIEDVWPWVDAAIYSFVPFVVIMVLNTMIVRQVIISKRDRGELCQQSTTTMKSNTKRCQSVSSTRSNGQPYQQSTTTMTPRSSHQRTEAVSKAAESTKLSVMLLTVSFAFLITTFPMNTTLIAVACWTASTPNRLVADLSLAAKLILVRTVCELLMYVNHSINFFLYCATGQKFRRQLCSLWRSPQRRVTRFEPVVGSHCMSEYRASKVNNCDAYVDNVAVQL